MNPNYGKLVNGAIIYAPSSLNTPAGLIVNPKRLSYLQAGWKTLKLDPPKEPAPEGMEYRVSGYTFDDSTIEALYKLVPAEKPPRTFSKLQLINALMSRGLWTAFRDWLDTAGLYDLFVAAQEFREDHPQFTAALSAAKTRFGLTDETLAAILEESATR